MVAKPAKNAASTLAPAKMSDTTSLAVAKSATEKNKEVAANVAGMAGIHWATCWPHRRSQRYQM